MGHECEDCGRTFDTLTGLRLHDCPPARENEEEAETSGQLAQSGRLERERLAHRVIGGDFEGAARRGTGRWCP